MVLKLSPKDLQTLYVTNRLGTMRLSWDKQAKLDRLLDIKFKQILLLRATVLTKSIAKKDISIVKVKFEKKLNFDFGEINISLREAEMTQVKIINMSRTVPFGCIRKSD